MKDNSRDFTDTYPLTPFDFKSLKSNITFGELQDKSFEELSVWIDELRAEIKHEWDKGRPPYIGIPKDKIIEKFKKLKDYDISKMFVDDSLYPDTEGFIKNFSKMGNSVNQFFPGILESRIHGKSIYDYLSKDSLRTDFKYTIVQKVRFDKLYMFSKYLVKGEIWRENKHYPEPSREDIIRHIPKHKRERLQRHGMNLPLHLGYPSAEKEQRDKYIKKFGKPYVESLESPYPYYDWLNSEDFEDHSGSYTDKDTWENFVMMLSFGNKPHQTSNLKQIKNIGFWFEDYDFNKKNKSLGRVKIPWVVAYNFIKSPPDGIDLDSTYLLSQLEELFQPTEEKQTDEKFVAVRIFKKDTPLFPELFQTFRVGLNQVATQFPPLTARLIYEMYLKKSYNYDEVSQNKKFKVYDFCAGWGGRLLGSLCSNTHIHYVGTDVNKNNNGSYQSLGKFYNRHTGGTNTFEIYQEGSEVIHHNKDFMKKHKLDIDLIFTSPPYFDRELYSEDKEQSCLKFPKYQDWLEGYLKPSLNTCFELLKTDHYCLINICDIKVGTNTIPLEQDTIRIAMDIGFEFEGKLGMTMTRMLGLNPTNSKNNWFDRKTNSVYKVEPILIMKKTPKYPWEGVEDEYEKFYVKE